MTDTLEKLKKISLRNRQRIIEIVGLDLDLQQVMIMKYCTQLSRDEMANRLFTSVETIDRKLNRAKTMFNEIIENEYNLFTDDQKEVLNLLTLQKDKEKQV